MQSIEAELLKEASNKENISFLRAGCTVKGFLRLLCTYPLLSVRNVLTQERNMDSFLPDFVPTNFLTVEKSIR